MKIFTAKDIALMGDPDPEFGQTYWGTVEEQSAPIRFNLKQQVDIMPGRKLIAPEYEERKSKGSNKPYTQLRKVKLSEDGPKATEEDEEPKSTTTTEFTPIAEPSYEAGTNARWALKLSTDTYKSVMGRVPEDETDWDVIEDFAKWLLGAFVRLKNFEPEGAGYQRAKAARNKLKEEENEDGRE